jgi:hypothetical protein
VGISISHLAAAPLNRLIPNRRNVACASAVVAVLVGPVSLATAHAAASTAPVAAHSTNPVRAAALVKPAQAPKTPTAPAKAPAPAPAPAKTTAPAPAVPAKPVDPYAAATNAQLEPTGLYGSQEYFSATSEEWSNAKVIVQVAKQRGMDPYAAVIAVATAMQESSLHNLTTAVDADSLGLFQQRPSMGWGSASELTNPAYASNAFLSALTRYAPNYDHLSLWQAAQDTQRSGYPTAYARWEDQAARMVHQIATGG